MSKPRFARAATVLLATSMLVRSPAQAEALETEQRQPMVGHEGVRFVDLAVAGSTYNAESRTVEAVLSAGSAVRLRWFTEELEISEEAIDLSRVGQGLVCLLDAHNRWEAGAVLGTVTSVRIENGELVGTLKFGDTDRAREIEGVVSRGELRGISIGYKVTEWKITRTDEDLHEYWLATRWELLEVSLVPVPADANARVRSERGPIPGATEEEEEMRIRQNTGGAAAPAQATAAPAAPAAPGAPATDSRTAPAVETRTETPAPGAQAAPAAAPAATITRFSGGEAVAFVEQARSLGGDALVTRANDLIQQNERGEIGAETARSTLLQAAAEAQRAATAPARTGPSAEASAGNEEASRNAIVTALVARATGRSLTDQEQGSREFMGMSILDLARARGNVSASERDPDIIMRAAHTTSDFPLIMEATGQRILLERYQAQPPSFQRIARQRHLRDFRPTRLLRVGDFPTLKPYLEDGEIKLGTIGEGKEEVQLGSFGRRLNLSRQAIINDDLGAFDEVFGSIGIMIAQFENATFYSVKSSNSGAGPKLSDGKAVFHADHGNLAAAGTYLDVAGIGKGRAAIRKQKNIDGQVMNLAPRILLVGAELETEAEKLTSPLVPQQVGNVNPFAGRLEVVSEGSIENYPFELYADPAVAPVWVYGSLQSAPAPKVMTKESWSTDGIGFRVTYDFYAGAIDYRGAYRNPGAAPA